MSRAPVGARRIAAGKRGAVSALIGWPAYLCQSELIRDQPTATSGSSNRKVDNNAAFRPVGDDLLEPPGPHAARFSVSSVAH